MKEILADLAGLATLIAVFVWACWMLAPII